ncbi:MAG: hypothetical protein JXQ80_12250 [Bacteroidales bacterium]|nr:hypothetical protein [Bacteroidales bacterium]
MIKGIANIIEWIRANDTENWKIRNVEKGPVLISSPNNDTLTVDDTINYLQKRIELLEPGVYFIEAYKHHSANNTWCKTRFAITGNSAMQPGEGYLPAVSGFSKDQVQDEIQRALSEYQVKTENERLRQENAELRSRQENVMMHLGERFIKYEPYLGAFLDRIFPGVNPQKQASIAGIKTQDMEKGDLTQRAERAVEQWYQLDKDAIVLMESIVKMARENPAMYNQAKAFLMK